MTAIADSFAPAQVVSGAGTLRVAGAVVMARVANEVWEDVIAGFGGVCQEQLLTFARLRWPKVVHEPMIFSIGGEVVGGCLVMIQRFPLGIGALAISKWGPMLADVGRADAAEVYAGMVEAMIAEYSRKRGMMLSILSRASVEERNAHYDYLLERGFRPAMMLNHPLRYIVKLRLGEDEQRRSFEQKWRYQLSKSMQQGLAFEHGGSERLAEFSVLYESMLDRKKFADHSAYETIPALVALDHPLLRPELFFVRKGGKVIAGAIIFKAGDRAVYLYGATLEEALPLRAGYFLHWNIICWLKDNTRADWYDLGGTDGFHGLHQFKKGMVGSAGVIRPVPRVMNYADSALAYALGSGALWAREGVQEILRRLHSLRKDCAQPTMPRYVESPADARL
jgi:hypothetical protein